MEDSGGSRNFARNLRWRDGDEEGICGGWWRGFFVERGLAGVRVLEMARFAAEAGEIVAVATTFTGAGEEVGGGG